MEYRDEIRIDELKCFARHGVFQKEKDEGQYFYINLVMYTDTSVAGKSDDLEASTDYGAVCHFITEWMEKHTYDLLERVAEGLAKDLLLTYTNINGVDLEIRKPQAPIGLPFGSVSVKIHREWHVAYLSVGSNMGEKQKLIEEGIRMLTEDTNIRNVITSELLVTKPYGGVEQDDFVNGAVKLETLYSPADLLEKLHEAEQAANRERIVRWGPRTLDLDIVFYDKLVYEDENLIIPHVDMENRYFVLKPLMELAPNYRHPILQRTVTQLLLALGDTE